MKIKLYFFLFFVSSVLLLACSGNSNKGSQSAATEVSDITDSNKSSEDILREEIIGTWTSFETVRGETILFEEGGKYSGYDGREEYEGTWEIKENKINLSLGGWFKIDIINDTLHLDDTKYLRQQPALSDRGNK